MICLVVLLQGEHVANACSALVAFYAVSLWETMSDHVASPLLDVFAERLQVRIAGISSAIIAAVAWPGKRLDSALLARASLLADRSCSSSRQMSHQTCKLNERHWMLQDKRESVRDAASTLMSSCGTPRRSSASRSKVPVQAAALLELWDGSSGGLSPGQCREHAAQVGFRDM